MITFDTLSVIEFASNELKKYLKLLGVSADIKLGLFEDFNLKAEVEDPYFDDAYAIKVEGKKGYVCTICGYVHEGELPEDFICPLCKHPASDFVEIA